MEDKQDFIITNGVLINYTGPGGDVTIPTGVIEIRGHAFESCTNLTSVTIPVGVTKIEGRAFSSCTSLTSVTILEGVTIIEDYTFNGCKNLTNVTIPEGVTKFGWWVFGRCANLQSVIIPESVKKIIKPIGDGGPPLIALHIPISNFSAENKPGACAGFAKAYLDGWEMDEEIKAGYLKYIKRQRKWLSPEAVQYKELLQLMLAEKMLVRKDIAPLLKECDRQNNIAAKAAVLDYAGRI